MSNGNPDEVSLKKDTLIEGEYVRMQSQKKEGEVIFEQLR